MDMTISTARAEARPSEVAATVACDVCGATRAHAVIETPELRFGLAGTFEVVRCALCGLLRTEPQPADLDSYYPSGDYYSYQTPSPPSPMTRARVLGAYGIPSGGPRWRDRLAGLARSRMLPGLPPGPPGAILDVGCGSGAFLLALQQAGWECHGIEIEASAVAAAHAAGLQGVQAGELHDAGYADERFDAIRFWHVLEHVRSPRAELTEACRVLRPGGSLTIGVPHAGSLLFRVAREQWYYLDVPRHLWHFDRHSLTRLVTECGFELTRIRLVSTGSAIAGTLGYMTARGERLVRNRPVWYAALPIASLLDRLGHGDAIELTAVRTKT